MREPSVCRRAYRDRAGPVKGAPYQGAPYQITEGRHAKPAGTRGRGSDGLPVPV